MEEITLDVNLRKSCLRIRKQALVSAPLFQKYMSQHRSLKGSSTIAAKRNVLKRFERVEVLKRRNQWKDGDRVIGLRKTKPDA
jgi:small basic protein (TIGR04137 family)